MSTSSNANSTRSHSEQHNHSFQNIAHNILNKNYTNPNQNQIPMQMPRNPQQFPLDIFSVQKLYNADKGEDEDEEYEEYRNEKPMNKYMKAINKQTEMLERIKNNFNKDTEENGEVEKRFLHKEFKKLEKYKENPREFFRKEPLNYSILNNQSEKIFDPLEMLYKFQKNREKNEANSESPPFLNPLGGPLGMMDMPLPLINTPFNQMYKSFELNPFGVSPITDFEGRRKKELIRLEKEKTKRLNKKKYNEIMKHIVVLIIFLFFFNKFIREF